MKAKHLIGIGAILAALAVGTGAFGAHGLETWLEKNFEPNEQIKKLNNWNTAAQYQIWHAIGLILIGVVALRVRSKWLSAASIFLMVGVLLFSGGLYAYVLTGTRSFGMVIPIGGLAFTIGWVLFAIGSVTGKQQNVEAIND